MTMKTTMHGDADDDDNDDESDPNNAL